MSAEVPGTRQHEICICAAIRSAEGMIVRGQRHHDCMRAAEALGLTPDHHDDAQGFITSANRYVDRRIGRILQDNAGIPSASREGYRYNILFSEDLY